jgi:hypothetical protein
MNSRLHKNLHATTQAKHKVEGGLLLDVVIREGATIFKLLAGKDQALLVRRDALLVLDFRLHVVDGVRRLDLEGDRFPGERLDEDLHPTTKTKDKMKGGLLLNVVIRKGTTIFELLASEDQALLVWWDALFVLNLCLYVVDSIGRLNLERNCFPGERLHEDLHATAETKYKV